MATHDVRLRNGAFFEFSFMSLLHLQADGMQSMLSMSKVSLPLLLLHHFLDIVSGLEVNIQFRHVAHLVQLSWRRLPQHFELPRAADIHSS
jgi:hypothetical protein